MYDGYIFTVRLSKQSHDGFEYTVAWVDCSASGEALGRRVFIRGNHVPADGPMVKDISILAGERGSLRAC
jgi:hypothetical protein